MGYSPWGRKRVRRDLVAKQQFLLCYLTSLNLNSFQRKFPIVVSFGCVDVCVCMLNCVPMDMSYNHMDCSPPGSSAHGILQARILEWVAMPSSRGSFQGSNPHVLCLLHGQVGSSPLVPPGKARDPFSTSLPQVPELRLRHTVQGATVGPVSSVDSLRFGCPSTGIRQDPF